MNKSTAAEYINHVVFVKKSIFLSLLFMYNIIFVSFFSYLALIQHLGRKWAQLLSHFPLKSFLNNQATVAWIKSLCPIWTSGLANYSSEWNFTTGQSRGSCGGLPFLQPRAHSSRRWVGPFRITVWLWTQEPCCGIRWGGIWIQVVSSGGATVLW